MYWDEMAYFLALARTKSLNQAAKELGVNHTTVGRRVRALEERLGTSLFNRTPDGFQLTAAGEETLPIAERVEREMHHLERQVLGRDAQVSGVLRFSTIDVLAAYLAPAIGEFKIKYPKVELQLLIQSDYASLARREADVALRLTYSPPEYAFGRRIASVRYAAYAHRDLVDRVGGDAPLSAYPWITWTPGSTAKTTEAWLKANGADNVAIQTDTPIMLTHLVRSGMGAAPLYLALGEPDPDLVRLTDPIEGFDYPLWLLTHEDLQHTARVRAFMDHIGEALAPFVAAQELPD